MPIWKQMFAISDRVFGVEQLDKDLVLEVVWKLQLVMQNSLCVAPWLKHKLLSHWVGEGLPNYAQFNLLVNWILNLCT